MAIRLQKLHNRAARIIANLPNGVDQQTALDALGLEPLKEQRKNKAKAKIMPKCHNLRDSSITVCLPQPRTNNMKKSLMFDGAPIWNSLYQQT